MKTIFEEITQSPETLGNFLDSLPVLEAPWDKAFQERFCAMCKAKNCDAENCEHIAICAEQRPLVRLPAATWRSPTATLVKVFR